MRATRSIAIIGAGFSGTILACTLIKKSLDNPPAKNLKIILIESNSFAQGIAYSTVCPVHLLNVPASEMSAFSDEPDHFFLWAQKKDKDVSNNSFLPRILYKEYLEELLNEFEKKQTLECGLKKINERVIALKRKNNKYELVLGNGEKIVANQVVLAMGNFPPLQIQAEDRSLDSRQKEQTYADPPFQINSSQTVSVDEDVFIFGTALSMIDCIAQLHHEGHKGKIHALSRHGFLPLPSITSKNSLFPSPEPFPEKNTALNWFRYIRKLVEKQNLPLLIKARIYLEENWSRFSSVEKGRYMRHLQSYVHLLHRVPPILEQLLRELIGKKQLYIHAGKLISVNRSKDEVFQIVYKEKGTQIEKTINAKKVFNCWGFPRYLSQIEDSFIQYLVENGWIRADLDGMILDRSSSLRVINAKGREMKNIFALGAIKKTAFPTAAPVKSIALEIEKLQKILMSK